MALLSVLASAPAAALEAQDIAFYYGTRPPVDALRHYDQVVVQPNQLLPDEAAALLASGPRIFAYVSVGEVARNSVDLARIDQGWVIGNNSTWNSLVMDLAGAGWREFLLREHFTPLWQQGYRAFFLDTMDSYLLAAKDGAPRQRQEDGMVALLAEIKQRFPGVQLIFNRGFELLDRDARYADGILAESLFQGYDPVAKKHGPTPEANRTWLISQLRRARDQFGIPVTVIDYVDPGDWTTAEATARKILELGFMPWVANGDLTWLGQGRIRHVPRTLLALIDGGGDSAGEGQLDSPLFKHLALPLEYEGYALDYLNIEQDQLPGEPLLGRYAGVVSWLGERSSGQQAGVCARLQPEVKVGLPVAFFGSLPAGAACQQLLGYQQNGRAAGTGLRISAQDPAIGKLGTAPALRQWGLPDVRVGNSNQTWLQLTDAGGNQFDPIQIGSFGGLALQPYVMQYGADGSASWLLDPFTFLRAALRLPVQPAFELSTDNGRRIGLIDIRGDRLATPTDNGERAAGKLQELLSKTSLPATLALIEAEFDAPGLTDSEQAQRQAALKPLLELPQLELAAHTYSHPYFWPVFDGQRDYSALAHLYSVQIPNYAADLPREIAKPFDWLNGLHRETSSRWFGNAASTRNAALLIWSGDGKPGPAALATAQRAGVGHYGGGGIDWRFGPLKLAQLAPAARPTRWGTQVLTPLIDENSFARLWYGEALNYRKVLDWNRQLGGGNNGLVGARRLKPWSLSFHADAVLRPAGSALLHELLTVQAQEPLNHLWLSEYAQRVQAFQHASLARDLDGHWRVQGNGLHSLRIPASMGWPAANVALAGGHEDSTGRYLQLGADQAILRFNGKTPESLLLVDASAPLSSWSHGDDNDIRFRFSPRASVQFRIRLPRSCQLQQHGKTLKARSENPRADTARTQTSAAVNSNRSEGLSSYDLRGDAALAEVQLVCPR
ncbi:RNA-binding protein [Permianibacter sp. IMCC34836]|uniref:endo alpha-1,4 polygalactosaminidase n=1 Tax=Permianibacter fluminis TaxID=2738515 RepID=UPI001553F9DA|nr:endo alpha-1,4 polygalactosaminidase [Permianibacter fluminis]NQD37308.1 RNA-binding protein [Permianibacter fluminis]